MVDEPENKTALQEIAELRAAYIALGQAILEPLVIACLRVYRFYRRI